MQQVPAFSRLQTVPSGPPSTVGAKPKLWILNSWRDLVLYVGTPLLLIPAFALAQARWSPQDIYLSLGCAAGAERDFRRSHFCVGFVRRAFCSHLDRWKPSESGETRIAGHQHRVLVVLQQSRLKHPRRHRAI